MKKFLSFILSLIVIFSTTSCVFAENLPDSAINSPTSVVNNKFGIHITDEKDLQDASLLINSNGGDWGYVTFVITERKRS